jgi:tripartite-type tricarboxylate transporter receptor subunit TctC
MKQKNLAKIVATIGAVSLTLSACAGSGKGDPAADDFPNKKINMLVTFAAGGANDTLARAFAKEAEKETGQDVVVDNRTGGGGSVGQAEGASAKPDGYTVTLVTPSIVANPIFSDVPYDYDSFAPVSRLNNEAIYLVINTKDDRFSDIDSYIEYGKKNPGKLNVGVSGARTTTGLASDGFLEETEIKGTTVPHDGSADAIVALQGQHIDAAVVTYTDFQSQFDSGDVKPILSLSADEASGELEGEAPTATEQGLDIDFTSWRGLAVPADTDPAIVKKLSNLAGTVSKSGDYKKAMETAGLENDYLNNDDFKNLVNETHERFIDFEE